MRTDTEKKLASLILKSTIIVAIIQSTYIYLYCRSLWLDEAMLALNIVNRTYSELASPLSHNQIAPILFLWIEKTIAYFFNYSEYGLRFFPLLCYWFNIILFYRLIKKIFTSTIVLISLLSLFCFNYWLLLYGTDVKQYITDVSVMLIAITFLVNHERLNKKNTLFLAVFGVLCIFLSSVTPIILVTITLIYLIGTEDEIWDNIEHLLLPIMSWTLAFVLYYVQFVYANPVKIYMVDYWSTANCFLPSPFDISLFIDFFVHKSKIVLVSLYGFRYFGVFLPFVFFTGLWELKKTKNYKMLLLFAVPFTAHLILSAFKLYPFDLRMLLYTIPVLLLVTGHGLLSINNIIPTKVSRENERHIFFSIPFIFFTFLLIVGIPLKDEEIKGNLSYLEKNIQDGDNLFITPYAVPAYKYYQKINFFSIKNDVILEDFSSFKKKQRFLKKIQNTNGNVWLLFVGGTSSYGGYQTDILDSLKRLNHPVVKHNTEYNSDVYLFNFE